jgi:hypothetical protein
MTPSALAGEIDRLIRRAHKHWQTVCAALSQASESTDAGSLIATLPATNNSDVAHCLANIIRQAEGVLSWKALGASIDLCTSIFSHWQQEQHIELRWLRPR